MQLDPNTMGFVYATAVMGVTGARESTSDLAGPLAESKVFPSMVVQMIGVGEQTGALDQMLNKIADFYEEEVDVALADPALRGHDRFLQGRGLVAGAALVRIGFLLGHRAACLLHL